MALQTSAHSVHADSSDDPRRVDAALVEQVVAGSHEALASLYDRHGHAIYAAAARAGGDPSVAADIVQETFLALWDRAERFDPARGSLRTWLQTIARNRAVDHRRATLRQHRAATFSSFGHDDDRAFSEWLVSVGEFVASAAPDPGPEATAASRELQAAVGTAVATLSSDERTAITLAYGRGMSQSEIATALTVPLGTVKTRTRRALQRLRETLTWAETDGRPDANRSAATTVAPVDAAGRRARNGVGEPAPCLSAGC